MAPTQSQAPAILPAVLADLRKELASAIADEQSCSVPALCIRLGLPPGEVEEAHRGKFRYAQERLIGEGHRQGFACWPSTMRSSASIRCESSWTPRTTP